MQVSLHGQRTVPSPQYSPTQQADIAHLSTISVSLAIALHVVVISAIVAYRKYKATVLRQRVQHLNHLWHLDSSRKLT